MSVSDDIFEEQAIARISRSVKATEALQFPREAVRQIDSTPAPPLGACLVEIPVAGIPARTNDKPGRAWCNVIRPATQAHASGLPRQIDISATGPRRIGVHNRTFEAISRSGGVNEVLAVPDQYGFYYAETIPIGVVFRVALAFNSGTDGDATTQAAWKYDVTHKISGVSLLTNVDPGLSPHEYRRPPAGKMVKATGGDAYRDGSGSVIICGTNETLNTESC